MSQADRAVPSTGREGDQLTGVRSPVWDPGPSGEDAAAVPGSGSLWALTGLGTGGPV